MKILIHCFRSSLIRLEVYNSLSGKLSGFHPTPAKKLVRFCLILIQGFLWTVLKDATIVLKLGGEGASDGHAMWQKHAAEAFATCPTM